MNRRSIDRGVAVGAAIVCHTTFALAITAMAVDLGHGMQLGSGRAHGVHAAVQDLLLTLQFPLLHSWLLSGSGRKLLGALARGRRGRALQPTIYATIASLQLLAVFVLWVPSGVVWHRPTGALGAAQWLLFAAAWVFLLRALRDAGLAVQTGAAGWLALWRGGPVDYGGMPERGLFRRCRQPIYLGFTLVMGTAPCWSLDLLLLAACWSLYCVVGPLHKEARWRGRYGEQFCAYRAAIPYMIPRWKR